MGIVVSAEIMTFGKRMKGNEASQVGNWDNSLPAWWMAIAIFSVSGTFQAIKKARVLSLGTK